MCNRTLFLNPRKPFLNSSTILKKFSGKGGWTYIDVPKIHIKNRLPFGWIVIEGTIDTIEIKVAKLMSKGKGAHLFAVNAKLRKQLKKEVGDSVSVEFCLVEFPNKISEELIACFQNEPKEVYQKFLRQPIELRSRQLQLIHSASSDAHKIQMINDLFNKLQ